MHSSSCIHHSSKVGFHGVSIRDLHIPEAFRAFGAAHTLNSTSRNVNAALLAHTGGHPLLKLLPTVLQRPQS